MENQLVLLDDKSLQVAKDNWRLDERTKQIGRQGIAGAREALRKTHIKKQSAA